MTHITRTNNIVTGEGWRVSVLTDRLLRLEYEKNNDFTDEKTLNVINRSFKKVDFTAEEENGKLILETDKLSLSYDERPFSSQGFTITLKDSGEVWNFGDAYGNGEGNFFGTVRTLDNTHGAIPLDKGLFSWKGTSIIDDSKTAILLDNGETEDRKNNEIDVYFFGYGKDYKAGLKAFAALTGKTPMIPRYALGNWWSKFEKYTEDSYIEMLDSFDAEKVPISVGVIDMDWHLTDIDPKYGNGWTGFTWNSKFFPDYRRFLEKLHERGLAVTLNLHPADGIRAFESMYPEAAKDAGIDPATEEPVPFDLSDPVFRNAYFDSVIHPYEKDGVDFWWIDWQQGTQMGKSNVDPLWLCNHYHFMDQQDSGRRAMIFSRYAGPGSHRYPIGFSGDTYSNWDSLGFQPLFTQTASNIGYGWWSHDIGGHMLGDKDDERLTRWIQFGVFSPIMRLHSSASPFFIKEPWKLDEPYRAVIDNFMRLRHRMIPYLYTMNYENWKEDIPLIRPMYYESPDDTSAYDTGNCYWFGSQLVVGAVTKPIDKRLRMADTFMYLPEGRFIDVPTGRIYEGPYHGRMYRRLNEIPVLLKEGGILPLASSEDTNARKNPGTIDLFLGAGRDGDFTLYEDDGITTDYRKGICATTEISMHFDEKKETLEVKIGKPEGNATFIPENRRYRLHLMGVTTTGYLGVDEKRHEAVIECGIVGRHGYSVEIRQVKLAHNDHKNEVLDLIQYAWTEIVDKDRIWESVKSLSDDEFLNRIDQMDIDEKMKDAIHEIYHDR